MVSANMLIQVSCLIASPRFTAPASSFFRLSGPDCRGPSSQLRGAFGACRINQVSFLTEEERTEPDPTTPFFSRLSGRRKICLLGILGPLRRSKPGRKRGAGAAQERDAGVGATTSR